MLLCNYEGQDLYLAAVQNREVIGYGMLRGWDAGYEIPSLGIIIAPEARGTGLGALLMHYMHHLAKLQGAARVRLKVYPENQQALSMYRKLGYVFDGTLDQNQFVGYCAL